MHNLGYLHNDDIEFPYTCDDCCIGHAPGYEISDEAKEMACKVCTGNYTNSTDKDYLKDIAKWAILSESHKS